MIRSSSSIGNQFRTSLAGGGDANALTAPPPAWPYALGTIGALIFGVGALLFMCLVLAPSRDGGPAQLAIQAMAVGSGIVAIAWIGVARHGVVGVGPLLGSLALPAGFAFVYANRHNWSMHETNMNVLAASLGAFALGHVFARGVAVTTVSAVVALAGVIADLLAHGRPGAITPCAVFGGLAMIGFSLALELPTRRRAPA